MLFILEFIGKTIVTASNPEADKAIMQNPVTLIASKWILSPETKAGRIMFGAARKLAHKVKETISSGHATY